MTVSGYAKVNLTLEVFGKRPDGYHALRSVVMPISLADTLEIEATDDGTISSDTGYDDDLCVKAARVLKSSVPSATSSSVSSLPSSLGASIHVTKRIPAGGGLGGGSADAAAVLRALNELWALDLSREELAEIGAQVGSDVPALVLGAPVLMEGRGERVKDLRLETGDLNLVLVNPGVHSSTKDVYAAFAERASCPFTPSPSAAFAERASCPFVPSPSAAFVERASCPFAGSPTAKMADALRSGDLSAIAAAAMNDLQAPAVKLHPEIADALTSLRTTGATGVTMTGSGSCVFGFVPDAATAEKVSAELNLRGYQAWPLHAISLAGTQTETQDRN